MGFGGKFEVEEGVEKTFVLQESLEHILHRDLVFRQKNMVARWNVVQHREWLLPELLNCLEEQQNKLWEPLQWQFRI